MVRLSTEFCNKAILTVFHEGKFKSGLCLDNLHTIKAYERLDLSLLIASFLTRRQ
jgi:hypothetical protein